MSLRELFESDVPRSGSGAALAGNVASGNKSGASSGRNKKQKASAGSRATSSKTEHQFPDSDDVVNVCVRVRPDERQRSQVWEVGSGSSWASSSSTTSLTVTGTDTIRVEGAGADSTRDFTFTRAFGPDADQRVVFEESGLKHLVDMAMAGYSCTVFAFGQTGSGKTHTITGPLQLFTAEKQENSRSSFTTYDQREFGLIQRSFLYLNEKLQGMQNASYTVQASYYEIYNESLADLLNPTQHRHVNVRWHKERGFFVENLFLVPCDTVDDLIAIIEEGMCNRQAGPNNLNEHSTRSHAILTFYIESEIPNEDLDLETAGPPTSYLTRHGKLTFVDLAGSEKQKDHGGGGSGSASGGGASGDVLVEANNINRSLLVLGNCISALADPKKRHGHIPFRDSKLTKLLSDSLGGQGVTLMMACLSASPACLPESLNTLRYASRARRIKNKPVVKMDPREQIITSLKRELKLLRSENEFLRNQLKFPASRIGSANTNEHLQNPLPLSRPENGEEKGDNALYSMLQEYMIENESLRSENSDLLEQKEKMSSDHQILSRDNEKLTRKLNDLNRIMASSPVSHDGLEALSPGTSPSLPYQLVPHPLVPYPSVPLQPAILPDGFPSPTQQQQQQQQQERIKKPQTQQHPNINSHSPTLHQRYSNPVNGGGVITQINSERQISANFMSTFPTGEKRYSSNSDHYSKSPDVLRKVESEPNLRSAPFSGAAPLNDAAALNEKDSGAVFHHQPRIVRNWQRAAAASLTAISNKDPPKKAFAPTTSYRDRFMREMQRKNKRSTLISKGGSAPSSATLMNSNGLSQSFPPRKGVDPPSNPPTQSSSTPTNDAGSGEGVGDAKPSSLSAPGSGAHRKSEIPRAASMDNVAPKMKNSYVNQISSFNQRLTAELSVLDNRIKREAKETKREQRRRKIYWPT